MVHRIFTFHLTLLELWCLQSSSVPQGTDPSPLPLSSAKAGRNHLK